MLLIDIACVGSPFLWKDERGHWHMIMHNMGGKQNDLNASDPGLHTGAHAFSRDGVTWHRSGTAPYTSFVSFADGSSKIMKRRERPQLLLSTSGQPRYFSSGVVDEQDHSYTLVMAVSIE